MVDRIFLSSFSKCLLTMMHCIASYELEDGLQKLRRLVSLKIEQARGN